jgi:hypothetical protein
MQGADGDFYYILDAGRADVLIRKGGESRDLGNSLDRSDTFIQVMREDFVEYEASNYLLVSREKRWVHTFQRQRLLGCNTTGPP